MTAVIESFERRTCEEVVAISRRRGIVSKPVNGVDKSRELSTGPWTALRRGITVFHRVPRTMKTRDEFK